MVKNQKQLMTGHYSAPKGEGLLILTAAWMNRRSTVLSERSQAQETVCCVISILEKAELEIRWAGARGCGWVGGLTAERQERTFGGDGNGLHSIVVVVTQVGTFSEFSNFLKRGNKYLNKREKMKEKIESCYMC